MFCISRFLFFTLSSSSQVQWRLKRTDSQTFSWAWVVAGLVNLPAFLSYKCPGELFSTASLSSPNAGCSNELGKFYSQVLMSGSPTLTPPGPILLFCPDKVQGLKQAGQAEKGAVQLNCSNGLRAGSPAPQMTGSVLVCCLGRVPGLFFCVLQLVRGRANFLSFRTPEPALLLTLKIKSLGSSASYIEELQVDTTSTLVA